MGATRHRRYRSLVQPSFVPAKAQWWIANWIERTVNLLVDGIVGVGRAELNVDFAAAIPVLTITGSFGVPVEQALIIRQSLSQPMEIVAMLEPIVAARREQLGDDLISVLVEAEYTDDDGVMHQLSDPEIYSFAMLLLAAGSGTTWKQMGITLAALLQRPDVLDAVREDRQLLRAAIDESLRWMPTDPMFSRHVASDVEFQGVHIPAGSVLHLCLGACSSSSTYSRSSAVTNGARSGSPASAPARRTTIASATVEPSWRSRVSSRVPAYSRSAAKSRTVISTT